MRQSHNGSWALGVYLAVLLLVFHRGIPDVFDLTKAVAALSLGPVVIGAMFSTRSIRLPGRTDLLLVTGAILALLASAFTADHWMGAWVGQERRFTGLAVVGMLLLVGFAANISVPIGSEQPFLSCLFWTAVPFTIYGVMQSLSIDPFVWTTETFTGTSVFSTMGNPNFAAWSAAFLIPVALLGSFSRKGVVRVFACFLTAGLLQVSLSSESIQGPLAVIFFAFVLLFVLLWYGFVYPNIAVALFVIAAHQSYFSISGFQEWSAFLMPVIAGAIWLLSAKGQGAKPILKQRQTRGFAFSLLLLGGIGLILVRPFLVRQLGERRAFASAAWRIFLDNPVTGIGFEQFGFHFVANRPRWHGEQLERSVASSPHSFVLGILIAGGILLAIPLCALFLIGLNRSFRRSGLKTGTWTDHGSLMFLLQVQVGVLALVAVEQVAVIALTAIIMALNFRSSDLGKHLRWKPHLRTGAMFLLSILLVGSTLISVKWVSGNRATGLAIRNLALGGSVDTTLNYLDDAVSNGPAYQSSKLQRAYVLSAVGNEEAVVDALEVATYYEYVGSVAEEVVKIASTFGRYEESLVVLQNALERDKWGQKIRVFASGYLDAIQEELESSDQLARLAAIEKSEPFKAVFREVRTVETQP